MKITKKIHKNSLNNNNNINNNKKIKQKIKKNQLIKDNNIYFSTQPDKLIIRKKTQNSIKKIK